MIYLLDGETYVKKQCTKIIEIRSSVLLLDFNTKYRCLTYNSNSSIVPSMEGSMNFKSFLGTYLIILIESMLFILIHK